MATDPGGYVRLWRKMLDSPIFEHAGLFRLWTYCLMRANWKDEKWLIPGTLNELTVPRGSFITGRETLHSALYPSRDKSGAKIKREYTPTSRTTWRWLEALEKMECVKLQVVSNRCTVVNVCNYNLYQDNQSDSVQPMSSTCPADVQPMSSTCPADVQPMSTNKEYKNIRIQEDKNFINEETKQPVKRFVKPTIEEIKAYCQERRNTVNPQKFFNHYESNGWRVGKNPMKDWKAAVRTWEQNNYPSNNQGQPQTSGLFAGLREFVEGHTQPVDVEVLNDSN